MEHYTPLERELIIKRHVVHSINRIGEALSILKGNKKYRETAEKLSKTFTTLPEHVKKKVFEDDRFLDKVIGTGHSAFQFLNDYINYMQLREKINLLHAKIQKQRALELNEKAQEIANTINNILKDIREGRIQDTIGIHKEKIRELLQSESGREFVDEYIRTLEEFVNYHKKMKIYSEHLSSAEEILRELYRRMKKHAPLHRKILLTLLKLRMRDVL